MQIFKMSICMWRGSKIYGNVAFRLCALILFIIFLRSFRAVFPVVVLVMMDSSASRTCPVLCLGALTVFVSIELPASHVHSKVDIR